MRTRIVRFGDRRSGGAAGIRTRTRRSKSPLCRCYTTTPDAARRGGMIGSLQLVVGDDLAPDSAPGYGTSRVGNTSTETAPRSKLPTSNFPFLRRLASANGARAGNRTRISAVAGQRVALAPRAQCQAGPWSAPFQSIAKPVGEPSRGGAEQAPARQITHRDQSRRRRISRRSNWPPRRDSHPHPRNESPRSSLLDDEAVNAGPASPFTS